ncbi:MAG: hypothetical protein VX278_03275 [Myxococcota bacterium]|nr:hypothetical protein [Myxococcota bacterium]
MRRENYTPFLFDFLCALLICFPILLQPTGKLLGSEQVDVWNHSWGAWWWSHQLSSGDVPWETIFLKWPEGGVLWFIDPIAAAIGMPIALLSTALSYNVVCFGYVVFASWSIRRFARVLGAPLMGEFIAAAAFACSGWMISELHNGISEACNIGPAALALSFIEQAHRSQKWTDWIKAGAAIALCFVASPYLGLGTGLVALVRSIPSIQKAWLGGIVSILLSLPTLLTMRAQLDHDAAIIKRPPGMNELLALHNAVDPRTFIAPFGFQSRDLSHEGFYHTLYLGLVVLFLAAWSARKHKLWVSAALVSIVFALGPYLYWGDTWVTMGEARLRLPWWFLQDAIPSLSITHPLRIGVPALAIAAAMAGASLQDFRIQRFGIPLLFAVFFDGLVLGGSPWPLQTANAQIPEIYQTIRDDTRTVGVLDLPTDTGSTMSASRYLYWQSYHNKPIPYSPDVRASTSSLLRYNSFRYLASLCERRADEQAALGLRNQRPSSPKELFNAQIGWIVLHKELDPKRTPALEAFLVKELGEGMQVGSTRAWKLDTPGRR